MKKFIFTIVFILLFTLLTGCAGKNQSETGRTSSVAVESSEFQTSEPAATAPKESITTADGTNAGTIAGINTGTNAGTNTATGTIATMESRSSTESDSEVQTVLLETTTSPSISDYFPYRSNTKYTFEGKGNEYASYTVFPDYISGNRIQLRINNGGSEIIKVLRNKDGRLDLLLQRGECYYRENLLNKSNIVMETLIKEPLVKGTKWILPDKRIRYISNMNAEITTSLGTYKAMAVTTIGLDNSKTIDYYSQGIGLVKSVYISTDGSKISSTLKAVKDSTTLKQSIRFYYPNDNVDGIYYIDKRISFHTNDITRLKLEAAYKKLPDERYARVLTDNTKINWLYLNQDGMVHIDFTKELVTEMNAGTSYEGLILQSITNTFGMYYGVNKVYLTIENMPYSSGHILMMKGEAFRVNLKNCSIAE